MKKRKLRRAPVAPVSCPCGSGKPYADCCGPVHDDQRQPADAAELVRARYSAFAVGNADYLWRTMHSSHDERARGVEAFTQALSRSLSEVRYRGLHILQSAEPDAHGIARVLFAVDAQRQRRDVSFVEQSDFVQEDGQWRYLLGDTRPRAQLSHPLSSMTLDHWQCGHHH